LISFSGELDPEIYSKLYNIYPENIAHIFIRDICQLPECLPSCQERYKKTFADIPKQQWTVFKDPKDIQVNIGKLIPI
jgi:phosphatidate phosphatase APP1